VVGFPDKRVTMHVAHKLELQQGSTRDRTTGKSTKSPVRKKRLGHSRLDREAL